MTRTDPYERVLAESIKRKRQRDAALEVVDRQAVVMRELQRHLLASVIGGRLLRGLADFELFVGIETVLDIDGRIRWAEVDQRLAELLTDRPELAASRA